MSDKRSPKEHEIDRRGTYQLGEFFTNLGGWLMDKITDYGEDFIIRISENGRFPGFHFFVQLKSTESLDSYRLNTRPVFSYSITQKNLRQWDNFLIPVVVILWDTPSRTGYWLHMQPYIESKVYKHPKWLQGNKKRVIHIPEKNQILDGCSDDFVTQLYEIFNQLSLGQYLGRIGEISETVYLKQQLVAYEAMTLAVSDNPYLWAGKAQIHYELREFASAYHAIEKAWEIDKENQEIEQNRACILSDYAHSNGNKPKWMLHEALETFKELNVENPTALSLYNIGVTLSSLREYDDALEYYNSALNCEPSDDLASQIWTNRGHCFEQQGLDTEAIRCFNQAITCNPQRWEAHSSLALAKVRSQQFATALRHFEQTTKVDPERTDHDLKIQYYYALTLLELDKFEEAYRHINYAQRLDPTSDDVQRLKGLILIPLWRDKQVDVSEAIKFHEYWLMDEPNEAMAKSELHLLYLARGEKEKARRFIEEAVQSHDVPAQVYYDYAVFLEDGGKVEEAVKQLEKAYSITPHHHIIHKLADLNRLQDRHVDALRYYEQIVDEEPEIALARIAECYFELGQHKQSTIYCCRLILVEPDNESWWINLATNLRILDKFYLYEKLANMDSYERAVKVMEEIIGSL